MKYVKGQTFGVDLLLAISVFMITIIIFFYLMTFTRDSTIVEELQLEAQHLLEIVNADQNENVDPALERITFIESGVVDENKLFQLGVLYEEETDEIRALLGAQHNFCIFLEGKDGVIPIWNPENRSYKIGIGSDEANISKIPCGVSVVAS